MTGPLAPLFAQVEERLSRGRDDDELLSGRDFRRAPWDASLAALSSIERHVQDMEKALLAVLEDPLGSHGARAVAREALGIPFTPRANWGPDHPSYDEMGQ